MAEQRVSALPDVPTMAEAGVADQEADTLTGIVAPAGTPKEIVDQLQRDIAKIVSQPDTKAKLDALGFRPVANTPAQFATQIKAEMDIELCASLGLLTEAKAQRLAASGVDRFNHNLETSERHYGQIVTTHSWRDRVETVHANYGELAAVLGRPRQASYGRLHRHGAAFITSRWQHPI
jgi:hypothetical protein